MRSNWFKYIVTVCLLVIYVNRGLFIAAPGIEMSSTNNGLSSEINSLLEVIINLTGGQNNIDEDGDCPETYNSLIIAQLIFDPNSMNLNNLSPNTISRKMFFHYDEIIPPLDHIGIIDQPPEQLSIDNG